MGRLLVALAREDARLRVAGAVEAAGHAAVGRDAGEVAGGAALGVRVGDDLAAGCRGELVVLDFTAPAAAPPHARVPGRGGPAPGGSRARARWANGRVTRSGSWGCAPATPSATTRWSSAASASASSSSTAPRAATAWRAGRCAPPSGWRGGPPASTRCATCSGCETRGRARDRRPRRGLPPPAARGAAAPRAHERPLPALLPPARLFPHALLVRTNDNRALAELLATGAADAILTDEAEADTLAVPGAVRLGPFTRDRKGYLGRDPALVAELDAWLRAREADGTLAT